LVVLALSLVVITLGINPKERLAWVILNLDGHNMRLANIYALYDIVERATWSWLANNLSKANWLICNDFNMVEVVEELDKEALAHV
jgi:hypothetical protein